jgi:hypothetical protein
MASEIVRSVLEHVRVSNAEIWREAFPHQREQAAEL